MKHDIDPGARLIHHPNARAVRVKKASWWKCFFAALGMSLVAIAIAWTVCAVRTGVPIPMSGTTAGGLNHLDGALIALVFYLLLLPPFPLALCFVSAIAAGIGFSRYRVERARACRSAALWAFSATLIVGSLGLPALVQYLKSS